MPAVFVNAKNTSLSIFSSTVTDPKFVVNTPALPMNVSTKVAIVTKGTAIKVFFDGKEVASANTPSPRVNGRAYFYSAGSPWSPRAAARVEDVSLLEYTTVVRSPPETEIPLTQSSGQPVDVPADLKFAVAIKPTTRADRWSNIFHLSTTQTDQGAPGSRLLAMWFQPNSTTPHIVLGTDQDPSWSIDTTALPLNVYTTVSIQTLGRIVKVFHNGTFQATKVAPGDRPSGRAHFYLSSPWYSSAPASVKNVILDDVQGSSVASLFNDCEIALESYKAMKGNTTQTDGCALAGVSRTTSGRINKIDWSSKSLSGSISPFLGYLPAIESIGLSNNSLTGSIPSTFSKASSLTSLSLANNRLSGTLPPTLFTIESLQSLNLANNTFSGSISADISALKELRILKLNENRFNGAIPPQMSDLVELRELYLASNTLSDGVPDSFSRLTSLSVLHLQNNALKKVTPWIGALPELTELRIGGNQIADIPDRFGGWPKMQTFSVYPNPIVGAIPPKALAKVPQSEIPQAKAATTTTKA